MQEEATWTALGLLCKNSTDEHRTTGGSKEERNWRTTGENVTDGSYIGKNAD